MPSSTHVSADQSSASRYEDLLWERYRQDTRDAIYPHNDTLETLLSHRSVRAYLPQPVPDDVLNIAISAAQSAATSSNLQAWSVMTIEDPAIRAQLRTFAGDQRHIEEAPLLLIWLADLSRLRGIAAMRGEPSEGLDYFESFLIASIDVTLAAQNALVAFEAQGLGGCYIGAMRNHPAKVAELLGLPAEVVAVFGMTIGYPDPDRPASIKPRLPREAVLHRGAYKPTATQHIAEYDEVMRAFQTEQSMAQVGWSKQARARLGSVEALKNRDKLRPTLHELGFGLK